MLDLLAGAAAPPDADSHRQVVEDMIRILEAQRLISLDTMFELADNLESLTRGREAEPGAGAAKLGRDITEIQLPRASLSSAEKNALAFGYWTGTPHRAAAQDESARRHRKGCGRKRSREAAGSARPAGALPARHAGRLQLRPLRAAGSADSAHQSAVRPQPRFPRHAGIAADLASQRKCSAPAGRRAPAGDWSVRSSALPYALAEAEQNFLIPTREQALIWGDLVPQMILRAKVPRWWNVTPAQMHWVGLHMRQAETTDG